MEVGGHRNIGRPKQGWSDVTREYMKEKGVKKDTTGDINVTNKENTEEEEAVVNMTSVENVRTHGRMRAHARTHTHTHTHVRISSSSRR